MTDSKRDVSKLRITPNTVILSNAGYKRCHKPGVGNSMQDLFHANQHICNLECSNPEPVFILEDDAELLAPHGEEALRGALREAIRLVRRPGVDCVALGCVPWLVREETHLSSAGFKLRWFHADVAGTTHALLISAEGRSKLSALRVPHWCSHDTLMYRRLRVLTPARPLAGQLHPVTENQKTWDPTGLLKAAIFDPAGCDRSASECYETFHSHLSSGGIGVQYIVRVLALTVAATAVAMAIPG